jgi:ABC-2 type transport system ATP-binding protein
VIAPAIRADGLTKYYGPVVAIEDLSFEVARGEIYGFLGANGAGKTTTIRLLLDLVRPARGTAAILGVDCHTSSLAARKLVGYLPGELPIYPDLSAAGYLDYLRGLDHRPVADGHLRDLLKRFDVSDVDLHRRLRDQSHGMKRKIGIVQALMGRAPVLILDEPTAGLDPLMIQAFAETLADVKRQGDTTVFLSSHVLAEVESTCDRIGVVRGGRVVTVGTVEELKRQAPRQVRIEFSSPVARDLPAVPGVTVLSATPTERVCEVRGPLGPLLESLAACPIHDVHVEPFRLEDYIVKFYASHES